MFDATDRAKLAELVQRAAANPVDMHDALNPATAPAFHAMMDTLAVHLGPFIIALSHERMPPDRQVYRHLSVSKRDGGGRPDDTTFEWIANEVGMGSPETWQTALVRQLEAMLPGLRARHAFKPTTQ